MLTATTDPAILAVLLGVCGAVAVLLWPARTAPECGPTGAQAATTMRDGPRPGVIRGLLRLLHRRRQSSAELEVLDGLAAALECGLPAERAIRLAVEAAPSSQRPGRVWSELTRSASQGQPLAPAWARAARHTGSSTIESVARAWSVAAATGSPLAAAVRASARAARERQRLERQVEIATAGARATATVLALLPVAGLGLAAITGVGPGRLYGSPAALGSAVLGLVLLGAGHLVVRRLVDGVRRKVT